MSDPTRPHARCAACGWVVYADATRCKHCGAGAEQLRGPPTPLQQGARCPRCEGRVHPHAERCKHCGHALGEP